MITSVKSKRPSSLCKSCPVSKRTFMLSFGLDRNVFYRFLYQILKIHYAFIINNKQEEDCANTRSYGCDKHCKSWKPPEKLMELAQAFSYMFKHKEEGVVRVKWKSRLVMELVQSFQSTANFSLTLPHAAQSVES